MLSPETVDAENVRLRDYERATGHQVLVYLAPTTGGVPIEDWAVSAFERWKVGRKNLDDGLVLFIFAQDRTVRIEVGYGLESKVPDVVASRIIRETIVPELQAGQPDRAVTDGVDRILHAIGDAESADGSGDGGGANTIELSPLQFILLGIFLFGVLLLLVRSPWLALALLTNIFGGGGGSFGGGGFSGGGGRSGGGGASGRW